MKYSFVGISLFLLFFVTSCKNNNAISQAVDRPIAFMSMGEYACDYTSYEKMAPALGLKPWDIRGQSIINTQEKKTCVYYVTKVPNKETLIQFSLENNDIVKNPTRYDDIFKSTLTEGLPHKDGVFEFKKFPDERFTAIFSADQEEYTQVWVNVDNLYFMTLDIHKLILEDKSEERIRRLVELILYKK